MKKTLALLLALAMLLVCFASCGEQPTSESSAEPSDEPSGETSENPYSDVEIEYETIVSVGKPYTLKPAAAADKYPDTYGMELCDGQYASSASYSDDKYCGISAGSGTIRVEYDLGDDYQQVYKFGVSYLSSEDAGIRPISTTRVFYSMDKENWVRTDFFVRPEFKGSATMEIAWLTLDCPVNARYVRFDIHGGGGWTFLDEVIIIANTPGSAANAKYLEQLKAAYGTHKIAENAVKKGTETIDRKNYTAISATKGMKYTVNASPDTNFPDNAETPYLTDGAATGESYDNGGFVGYAGGHQLIIDITLGNTVKGLADFDLAMYQQKNLSYMLPYYVDMFVSADGAVFEQVGRIYAPDDVDVTNFTYSVHLEKGVSAKAVRFVLAETESACFLIEEASASYYGVDGTRSLYDPVVLPEVTEALYWPKDSKDYSKNTNLALGLPYQIESSVKLLYNEEFAKNTLASAGILTDGKYSPNNTYNNGFWNMTHNGAGRNIYIDLGYNSAITGFKINYLNLRDYGISVPSYASMYLSEDGKSWFAAGSAFADAGNAVGAVPAECKLKKAVEARFVKIVFPVSPHTYVDEIEVYGTKKIPSGTVKVSECGAGSAMNQYMAPSKDVLNGVSDLMLIYYTIPTMATNEDYFLPYVAYLQKNAEDPSKYDITDTLFDGFLFLPSVGALPSGGMPYSSGENPNHWSDWVFLFEECFKEGVNFDALDKTAAKVKAELGLDDDFKLKVFVTIPYLHMGLASFGDADGDDVNEDTSKLEDIHKIISIYVDMYEAKFAEMNYANISLDGYYWFNEAMGSDNDPILVPEVARTVEEKGSQLFWIPYYCAKGYSTWTSYGFVTACMQPNYVFKTDRKLSQLEQAAEYIRQYGMGIEIEINSSALHDPVFFKRYMQYLGYGVTKGYMKDCIHMYYQDGATYRTACYSSLPMARKVYDSVYGFIKGTLAAPDKLDDKTFTCKKGEYVRGALIENEDNMLMATLVHSASHGSVSIAANGSFVYVPYDGFTGTDSFTFTYSNYLGVSEEITVTITVE